LLTIPLTPKKMMSMLSVNLDISIGRIVALSVGHKAKFRARYQW
jgi:hypothetical protein